MHRQLFFWSKREEELKKEGEQKEKVSNKLFSKKKTLWNSATSEGHVTTKMFCKLLFIKRRNRDCSTGIKVALKMPKLLFASEWKIQQKGKAKSATKQPGWVLAKKRHSVRAVHTRASGGRTEKGARRWWRDRKSQPCCYQATATETWKCHCSLVEQVYSVRNLRGGWAKSGGDKMERTERTR